jgi:single-stranded DNA-binding protein
MKGKKVAVVGSIQQRSWEKDGVKHQKLKVRASTIKFLPQGERMSSGPRQDLPMATPDGDGDDSIPF